MITLVLSSRTSVLTCGVLETGGVGAGEVAGGGTVVSENGSTRLDVRLSV